MLQQHNTLLVLFCWCCSNTTHYLFCSVDAAATQHTTYYWLFLL